MTTVDDKLNKLCNLVRKRMKADSVLILLMTNEGGGSNTEAQAVGLPEHLPVITKALRSIANRIEEQSQ